MCKKNLFITVLVVLFGISKILSQTIVSGNVSGTWNIGGSPYLFINDCTVQTGTELIIEPGVEIKISDSMSLNVYGKISAIGTSSQHIVFRAISNSVQFNQVYVQNGSSAPPVSEFKYCEFMNAQTGLYLHAYGRIDNDYTTMQTNVSNCSFDSSVSTGIYARAEGVDASQFMTPRVRHARVNPIISGCTFNGNGVGIEIYTDGTGYAWFAVGNTSAIIENNAFGNVSEAAISILPGSLGYGTPSIINNTIADCERGVWIQDGDFDATTINNIFYNTATAIERTGSNSNTTFYNCFYGNTINFVGYPATYGNIVMSNTNGDPCDIGFNIFQDPLFADSNNYILSPNSPCLGAGKDSIQSNGTWYYSPSTDIDGNLRPNPTGSHPDIGAYEHEKGSPTNIITIDSEIPLHFALHGNHPNPFNPSTTISYQLPTQSHVNLNVFDMLGREVSTLVNRIQEPGYKSVMFDASKLSSGVYYYRLQAGNYVETKKLLLLR